MSLSGPIEPTAAQLNMLAGRTIHPLWVLGTLALGQRAWCLGNSQWRAQLASLRSYMILLLMGYFSILKAILMHPNMLKNHVGHSNT